ARRQTPGDMSRALLGLSLALLLFFAYLTAIKPAYVLAYALVLLFLLAWLWPKLAARGIQIERVLDAGTPTVGEGFEETFTVRKQSRVPAPGGGLSALTRLTKSKPGRVISWGREAVTWTPAGFNGRRGGVTFAPTLRGVSDPFGLFSQHSRLNQKNQVLVYP